MSTHEHAAGGTRPNIVLILCDDMGFSDVGCFGSEIPTPHVDDLAARGLRMTHMYNAARCCPSRAALLTGLYPTQAGIGHMTETGTDLPGYEGRLATDAVTIAEALRGAGYRTGMAGKWHVGGPLAASGGGRVDPDRNPRPTDRGFERFFGTLLGAGSYYAPASLHDGETPIEAPEGFYYTDAITERAEAFVDEMGRGPDPFFLYVAHVAPHWPLHAPLEDVEAHLGRYLGGWDAVRAERHDRLRESGLVARTWEPGTRDERLPAWSDVTDTAWEDSRMAVYAAQIAAVDRGVGRLVAKLRELGIEERTLVVFLSDNGGCAELLPTNVPGTWPGGPDSFMSYGLPWATVSNTPFRRHKRWVHEGGIATPLVACWPGVIPAGHVSHDPAHVIDLVPTFLELAGVAAPRDRDGVPAREIEGESLVRVLRGLPSDASRVLAWEHEGNRAVRAGDLKLVSVHGRPWELYRMDLDRTETNDLADRYPRDVRRLEALHDDWALRTGVIPWDRLAPRLPAWFGTNPPEG
ncbi:MAG: sulfatase [Acidimicrobiia bacterium]|nr:MAG: sulfatase [Acidimicrobiia bacterium]